MDSNIRVQRSRVEVKQRRLGNLTAVRANNLAFCSPCSFVTEYGVRSIAQSKVACLVAGDDAPLDRLES
jgi:hypothetical protein